MNFSPPRVATVGDQASLLCSQERQQIMALAAQLNPVTLYEFYQQILFLKQRQDASLNWLVQFEHLAIDWVRLCAKAGLMKKQSTNKPS